MKVGVQGSTRSVRSAGRYYCLALLVLLALPALHTAQAQSTHSPEVALRWSIIPGGGQIYNKQAWKVPIIYGALAGMSYFIYDNYKSMKMFKDEYLYRVNHGGATNLIPRRSDFICIHTRLFAPPPVARSLSNLIPDPFIAS